MGVSLLFLSCGESSPQVGKKRFATVYGTVDFSFVVSPLPAVVGLQTRPLDPSEAPPGVSIPERYLNPTPRCTAFFVSPTLLLTAAHCIPYLQFIRMGFQAREPPWLAQVRFDPEEETLRFIGQMTESPGNAVALANPPTVWTEPSVDLALVHWPLEPMKWYFPLCPPNAIPHDRPFTARVYGFPRGLPLTVAEGTVHGFDKSRSVYVHSIDTLEGFSGGPLVMGQGKQACAFALHTKGGGKNADRDMNVGSSQPSPPQAAHTLCMNIFSEEGQESDRRACIKETLYNKAIPLDEAHWPVSEVR